MLIHMLPRKSINLPKMKSEPKKNPISQVEPKTKSKAKPLAMRLFTRNSKSKSKSLHSTSTSTSMVSATESSTPETQISISTFNAAGQNTTLLPQTQRPTNNSTTNLSTTSTLLDLHVTLQPELAPNTYEAFLSRAAREEEAARGRMAHAWAKAEERRRAASQNWPNDPWRGGFGPPSSGGGFGGVGRRDGGASALNPRRGGGEGGGEGVRGWLGRNGLVR